MMFFAITPVPLTDRDTTAGGCARTGREDNYSKEKTNFQTKDKSFDDNLNLL